MSNSNAYSVQRHLGLEPDYSGRIEASELRSLCLSALNKGEAASESYNRPGYLSGKTVDLLRLAEYSLFEGETEVFWS